jgi:DNA-directed RNA polymerase specialized sigma24 family protein
VSGGTTPATTTQCIRAAPAARTDSPAVHQEAYLQWQRRGNVEIASPRAFLSTIVTRHCINHLHTAMDEATDLVLLFLHSNAVWFFT